GRQQLARVLLGRPDVYQAGLADLLQDVVAVGPELLFGPAAEAVFGFGVARRVVGPGPALGLPLDAAAVDQLQVLVAVVLARPVGVGREPVVVVAVKHNRRSGRDATASEHP